MNSDIIQRVITQIPAEPNWPCHSALQNAIMTDRKLWPKQTVAALKPILAKYL
jgi:5'-methylthioadenosine phosphorylase